MGINFIISEEYRSSLSASVLRSIFQKLCPFTPSENPQYFVSCPKPQHPILEIYFSGASVRIASLQMYLWFWFCQVRIRVTGTRLPDFQTSNKKGIQIYLWEPTASRAEIQDEAEISVEICVARQTKVQQPAAGGGESAEEAAPRQIRGTRGAKQQETFALRNTASSTETTLRDPR